MRYARKNQLISEEGIVHKYWKCHNNEFLLQRRETKNLYFDSVGRGLRKNIAKGNIKLYAFALMGNHSHQLLEYRNGHEHLSNYMHVTHTNFGRRYNSRNNRSGRVGNERPKTPLIEDTNHAMRVHFYIEANPIRANICTIDSIRFYPYSSYSFYAYGTKTRFSNLLEIPDWYYALGKTPQQRQKAYRKLFAEYLGVTSFKYDFLKSYIGCEKWVAENKRKLTKKKLSPTNRQKSNEYLTPI